MEWSKELPLSMTIVDEKGQKHDCRLQFVGYGWYGNEVGLQYYEWDVIEDRKVPILSVRGNSEDEVIMKMKELIS